MTQAQQPLDLLDLAEQSGCSGEPHPRLDQRDRALIEYALRLTATPWSVTLEHVERLRSAGLDDGEILDANQVTAYFAYANRLVDGLGVVLEPA